MPMAAKIIRALINISAVRRIIVSGTSIRDGVVAINGVEREPARRFSGRNQSGNCGCQRPVRRCLGCAEGIFEPLKHGQNPGFARLLDVACNLADMCWHGA